MPGVFGKWCKPNYNSVVATFCYNISREKKITISGSAFSYKDIGGRLIYHIRFHLADGMSLNFTNNKKNIILKTKLNNIWLFKCDSELVIEDSILVDNNITKPTKQIVIKGILSDMKIIEKWSLEKI